MQFQVFTTIAIVLSSVASTNAAPGITAIANAELHKRTCGTLTGNALVLCQNACTAVCTAATVGLAKKLCSTACSLKPLKEKRDILDEVTQALSTPDLSESDRSSLESLVQQLSGLESTSEKRSTVDEIEQELATAELSEDDRSVLEELKEQLSALEPADEKRSIGSTICNGACAVTCNSTILALAQTACLKKCKSFC